MAPVSLLLLQSHSQLNITREVNYIIHSGAGKGNIPADSCLLVFSLLHLQSFWLLLSSLAAGCLMYLNSCLRAERRFQACSLVGSPDCTVTFIKISSLIRPAAKGKKAPSKHKELCLLYPSEYHGGVFRKVLLHTTKLIFSTYFNCVWGGNWPYM